MKGVAAGVFAAFGAVAWLSSIELHRKARQLKNAADREMRRAARRNDESIANMRYARAVAEEHRRISW